MMSSYWANNHDNVQGTSYRDSSEFPKIYSHRNELFVNCVTSLCRSWRVVSCYGYLLTLRILSGTYCTTKQS